MPHASARPLVCVFDRCEGVRCKVSPCTFTTACKTRYMQHFELFHTTDVRVMPRERDLAQPWYCRCGYRATKGNKLGAFSSQCLSY